VFVPRNLAFLLRLYVSMPPRGRSVMGKLFGVDKVAMEADHSQRDEYERRMASS